MNKLIHNEDKKKILLDESRGINIPKLFCENFDLKQWHITLDEMFNCLLNNDSENYWEVWDDLKDKAYYIDNEFKKWTLYQNENLYAIREDYNWGNEHEFIS